MTTTGSWGDAGQLLAAVGAREDTGYYKGYTAPDEKAVLTVPMRIQGAWIDNDPDAFADVFTENGSLLMKDQQLTSREEIRSFITAGFAGPFRGARVNGWPISLQFLTDDVAMVITEGGIIYAGQDDIAPENFIRATWVIRKQPDGSLNLVSHQSSPVSN